MSIKKYYKIILNKWYEKYKLKNWKKDKVINSYGYNIKNIINHSFVL